MNLLYLDDSGSAENKNEEYFVLGGVCVPERSVRWLSHQIEKIAEELDADNSGRIEFHASEIFGGRALPWSSFQKDKRISLIKRVLHTLDGAKPDVVVFACAIHKASLRTEDPVVKSFEELSNRFDLYLKRISTHTTTERGLIVFDKATYEISLQNLAKAFRNKGNRWGSYLKSIAEVPLFVDSKASRIIQLADHIAYAVFRYYNANDMNYFNCIASRFDQNEGVIHGLTHFQNEKLFCHCPACLTRDSKKAMFSRSDQPIPTPKR